MAFPACTADGLGAQINCLKCVSKDNLIAFLVKLFLDITNYELQPESGQLAQCLACYSDEDLLRMTVAIMAEYAVTTRARDSWSVEDLRDETKCYNCTDPHLLKAALLLLFCAFMEDLAVAPQ
jgi:hypothetical protein